MGAPSLWLPPAGVPRINWASAQAQGLVSWVLPGAGGADLARARLPSTITGLPLIGEAFYVDASNYLTLPTSGELDTWTEITAWVRFRGRARTGFQTLVKKDNGFIWRWNFDTPSWITWHGVGSTTDVGAYVGASYAEGQHIALGIRRAASSEVWLDHELNASSTGLSAPAPYNTANLEVGHGSGGEVLAGNIYEVRVYTRALDAQEIAEFQDPALAYDLWWRPRSPRWLLIAGTGAGAAVTLDAGAQAVVVTAPTATLSVGALTLGAGEQAVVVTAPTATLSAGAVTLAAGVQAVVVSAPTATLDATVALAAGAQAVVVSAPAATLSVGAVTLAAGVQAVVVTAPTATLTGTAVGLIVTIAGTDRSAYRRYGALDIDQPLGGRASATLELIDTAASPYRPTLDQEVVIALNGAPIFGGYIRDLDDTPIIEPARGVRTRVTLGDYGALCDQRIVFDKAYEAETLEDIVTDLWTDYLDVYGVTLTAMGSAGPTITAQFSGQTLTAVFTQLQSLAAGWLWQITADKSLRWFEVGDDTGPALGSGDARLIHWAKASKDYANRVILSYGGDRSGDQDVIFTAADLTGGRYLLPYPLAAHGSVLFFWTTASETQADERPWGSWGDPLLGFSFDASTNEVVAPSFASMTGFTFRFPYTTRFPIRITAEDGSAATNPVEVFVAAPAVTDATAAADLAAALLAERVASVPKTATVRTSLDGYAPGQQVAVSIAERSLSGTFLVTAVRTWHDRRVPEAANWLSYDLDLVEGTAQRRSWRDWWADISGTAGSAGSAEIVASGALGITVYKELGGSKRAGHKNTSWAEIMEALDVWIDSALWSSVTVRARVKTANAATQVKIRLYNETTAAAASDESDWYDDTSFVPVELKVNLASGVNQYLLQFKTDNTTWDVWVHAHLELYK